MKNQFQSLVQGGGYLQEGFNQQLLNKPGPPGLVIISSCPKTALNTMN